MLENTIHHWENRMTSRIDRDHRNKCILYHKAAGLCARELHYRPDNSVKNVLEIVLEVLEVSRVYIREVLPENYRPTRFIHEVSALGQMPALGPYCSVHEVLLSESNGSRRYLGIEDTLTRRTWNQQETDLVNTVATLLRATQEGKSRPASGWFNRILGGNLLHIAS
jgi:hypothetical protein